MGSFTSFLCCGADASNDTDDKYHKPASPRSVPGNQTIAHGNQHATQDQSKKGSVAPGQTNGHKPNNGHVQGATSKPAFEDENSVNESDTLTVPNEESPRLDSTNIETSVHKEEPLRDAANSDTQNVTDNQDPSQVSGIIASVEENGNDSESFVENYGTSDVSSTFDLSAMQENQTFNPETGFLLGKKDIKRFGNKKCLVLDLDETLVHSSFKYLRTADFVIPVEIEDQVHHVYVIKRPGVDEFLRRVGQLYEVVVFTASVAKYGDPLLNKLDVHRAVHQRLFRDSCYSYQGNFIKNLSQLGRPLQDSIIIDNSPASYIFHPQHSVPISSWFSDTHDNELLDLLPLLEDLSKPNVDDVSMVLDIAI
ncbi:hypothetical protein JCM33374_g3417 [Metschnikowia sp. JCM 33374]|nr:hypothetical protein JCM33374_g3417 [Metschnikowia sp. JCM 33374]